MRKRHDIFISYSRKDFEEVNKFVEMLKQCIPTLTYWFDVTGIESGDEFEEKIITAINNSSYVLFAFSENSMQSQWTKDEVTYAKNIGKKIIPILLSGAKMTEGWFLFKFGRIDCVDSTDPIQIDKLLRNLSMWTKKELVHKNDELQQSEMINSLNRKIRLDKGNCVESKFYDEGTEPTTVTFDDKLDEKSATSTSVQNDQKVKGGKHGLIFNVLASRKKGCLLTVSFFSFLLVYSFCFFLNDYRVSSTHKVSEVHKDMIPKRAGSYPDNVSGRKFVSQANMIDLNLSSGTLWADRNLGAKSKYDYGELYSWGEIRPKVDYSRSQYDTVRIAEKENIIGLSSFDAATNIREIWQLPRMIQFEELIKECVWSWEEVEDIKGYRVTGSNGNSIFFPASGWSNDTNVSYKDLYGYYWIGERIDMTYAKQLLFGDGYVKIGNGYLYYGRSIRPVVNSEYK